MGQGENLELKGIGCLEGEIVVFKLVDLCGRRETPAGVRGRGDPTGASAPRRLPVPPAESEAPGAQINRLIYTAK
jgi:hypothetical protein